MDYIKTTVSKIFKFVAKKFFQMKIDERRVHSVYQLSMR